MKFSLEDIQRALARQHDGAFAVTNVMRKHVIGLKPSDNIQTCTFEASSRAQRVGTYITLELQGQCGSQGVDQDGHCNRCGLVPIEDTECPPGFLNG